MKTNEWHWARLKIPVQIDEEYILSFLKSRPFILPKGTIIWAFLCPHTGNTHITIGPEAREYNSLAYQSFRLVKYHLFLEPLE